MEKLMLDYFFVLFCFVFYVFVFLKKFLLLSSSSKVFKSFLKSEIKGFKVIQSEIFNDFQSVLITLWEFQSLEIFFVTFSKF